MGTYDGKAGLTWAEGPAHSERYDGGEVAGEEVPTPRCQLATPCLTLLDGDKTCLNIITCGMTMTNVIWRLSDEIAGSSSRFCYDLPAPAFVRRQRRHGKVSKLH